MLSPRRVAAIGATLVVVVGFGLTKAGANEPRHVGPKIVKSKDVTDPNETTVKAVFRNGRFCFTQSHVKRKEEVDDQGHAHSVIEEDSQQATEVEAQLPTPDPALASVTPTREQVAEVDDIINLWNPEGPQPTLPPGVQSGALPITHYAPGQIAAIRQQHPLPDCRKK